MVRVAFHKGVKKGKRGFFLSWFIRKILRSSWSHVELNFPKEGTIDQFPGVSFSSRGTEKKKKDGGVGKGVQWKQINYSHQSRWDFIYLPFFNKLAKIEQLKCVCQRFIGKKYDPLGAVFWCGLRMRIEKSSKWWCSEIVGRVLAPFIYLTKWKLDPKQLYKSLMRKR